MAEEKEMLKCKQCGKEFEKGSTQRRKFCSDECYKAYQTEYKRRKRAEDKAENPVSTTLTCAVCGKIFQVEGKRKPKFCSKECRLRYGRRYNTDYITERRKNDEDFYKATREASARSSSKAYAKNIWNDRLTHAEAIMKLSKMKDGKTLIASYLDRNFVNRGKGFAQRQYQSKEEVKAGEVLESLGDEYLLTSI